MPELPEVESLRRSLAPLVGRRVQHAKLRRRDVLTVPGDPPGGWGRQRPANRPRRPKRFTRSMLLEGQTVVELRRRGKRLGIVGDGGSAIEVALGMTGGLELVGPRGRLSRPHHAHALWTLSGGGRLAFIDARRFGGLWAWPDVTDLEAQWARTLGPDALTIRGATLARRLAEAHRPVKAALLDQRVLAGVGNIYADEACFEAGIRPGRPASGLTPAQVQRLARAIRRILRSSIEGGGSTLRDFANADGSPGSYQHGHLVYGRAGLPCARCGSRLEGGRLAQRATVWCSICQPAST